MQDYTNKYLNLPKVNFYDSSHNNFVELKSFSKVLEELDINEVEYESALRIFDNENFQLRLSRPTNSCFFNNYFDIVLLAWEANIDIKPVFNYHKAVTHICSYLSKEENEGSQSMKQALRGTVEWTSML